MLTSSLTLHKHFFYRILYPRLRLYLQAKGSYLIITILHVNWTVVRIVPYEQKHLHLEGILFYIEDGLLSMVFKHVALTAYAAFMTVRQWV